MDLTQEECYQQDLFSPAHHKQSDTVMQVMDQINHKMGSDTLFIAAEGTTQPWRMRSQNRSPRYTTKWEELAVVC